MPIDRDHGWDAALGKGKFGIALMQQPPQEIHLVEALRRHFTQARHVLCFDSSFHASMPAEASMLPVPRRYFVAGIKRLG
ncbi:MAG: hypothetical protein C4345_07785, partial [Chloroflexota bacterium]